MICDLRWINLLPSGSPRFVLKFAGFALLSSLIFPAPLLLAFEGRITAVMTEGGQASRLLYTVGTNYLRIEKMETNWPSARDIVNLQSGDITLLFPHNRSFVRLKAVETAPVPAMPNMPGTPAGLPPGVGPHPPSATAPGAPTMPANPGMGSMPAMPMMQMEKMELKSTGEKTNLLGFACQKFELKQRGETMEIWAADNLIAFQPYLQNQPHRFGPRIIEEQWGYLLKGQKLFPLLATLKFDNGAERLRFEVESVTPQKLTDEDMKLFQPPANYSEIQALPF